MTRKVFKVIKGKFRLDKFLASSGLAISRAAVQRLIASGKVRVNGRVVSEKDGQVSTGDEVAVDYAALRLKMSDIPNLKVIYEDKDLIILDKPAGLLVHPGADLKKETVAGALAARIPGLLKVGDKLRPGIVHRLDADTSGLLVAAKTKAAYEYLKNLFKSRQILKQYRVLVHGEFSQPHGVWDDPIGRKTGEGKFRAGLGRPAKTEYWVEKVFTVDKAESTQPFAAKTGLTQPLARGWVDKFTLLKVQLHTGRTHQIRVHASATGHPVAGDQLYGGRFKKPDAKLFPRQFLHASALKFTLPGGREMQFVSPLPEDLQKSISNLKQL
jgi:23S rRNA pseudouridine1911/1915/1917 synthase